MRRTPAQERSRATVERILDAAAQVFGQWGYAATTNQIADEAGTSIGSLYQYFENKDSLLEALHARHIDRMRAHLIGRGPADADDVTWVRWFVEALTTVNSGPDATTLWQTSRVIPAMRDHVTALVDDIARDAGAALSLAPMPSRAVVVTGLGLVHELVLTSSDADAALDVAVRAVLAVARSA